MKRLAYHLAALWFLAAPSVTSARPVPLQTVDLTDKNMSAEGGEAKLYIIAGGGRSFCRIDVVHYGETGKVTYKFVFGRSLRSAVKNEYEYDSPIYVNPHVKAELRRTVTLASTRDGATLRTEFSTYKSLFDRRKLAGCSKLP